MVYEIKEKSIRQKVLDFIHEAGYKAIGAYVLAAVFLVGISINFFFIPKNQNIRQETSNPKNKRIESYLTRLRRLTPTQTPIPSVTGISPTIQASATPTLIQITITPVQETPIPTSIEPQKPGDINNDGTINVQDLSYLLSHWNKNDAPTADFNNDGIIDISDLSMLLSNWGK